MIQMQEAYSLQCHACPHAYSWTNLSLEKLSEMYGLSYLVLVEASILVKI